MALTNIIKEKKKIFKLKTNWIKTERNSKFSIQVIEACTKPKDYPSNISKCTKRIFLAWLLCVRYWLKQCKYKHAHTHIYTYPIIHLISLDIAILDKRKGVITMHLFPFSWINLQYFVENMVFQIIISRTNYPPVLDSVTEITVIKKIIILKVPWIFPGSK